MVRTIVPVCLILAIFAMGASVPAEAHGSRATVVINTAPAGHWEYVQRQIWIPGYYQTQTVHVPYLVNGYVHYRYETRQYWVPGYYKLVTDRVWVRHGHHHRYYR